MEAVKRPADVVREHIARYLGPFTSKNALQMVAHKLGVQPEQLRRDQVPQLLEALGPSLRTLLGKSGADAVTDEIRKELAL